LTVTESNKQENAARPNVNRASLSRIAGKDLPTAKAHLVFWITAILGTALDLWTKSAVFGWLVEPGAEYAVIDGFLHLVTRVNDGAAFGIAGGQRPLLIAVSAIALIVIIGVFMFSANEHKLLPVALGLFTAGVCGNLYDRIFNDGLVRDFIDVVYWPGRHWPAFNVADSLLCIAVGLLLISSLFTGKSSQRHPQQQK
jgi:signal peptidase II